MSKTYTGYITYDGPSMIDGGPVVSILTGLDAPSHNPKTGPMVQQWILRADQRPGSAIRTGDDYAICGNCPLRLDATGWRRCYVNPMGPSAVYRAYLQGQYETGLPDSIDRPIRLGAYGDPAALPIDHLRAILARSTAGHTGYTHQWRLHRARGLRSMLMASVETAAQADQAHAAGWRTFRVSDTARKGEIVCPASAEAGHRTTCHKCRLCDGSRGDQDRRRSIVIAPHGSGASRFHQVQLLGGIA